MPSNSKDIGSTNGTASEVSDDLWAMVLRGVDCSGYLTTRMRIKTTLPPAASTANNNETDQYFYHPDHLGSSSFVSDAIGYATQHLQYLPYGETFVDQHGAFDSRYTFSAKEKDDETQYSYFGARYYDSDLSVWLSVDPLSDEYPHQSPFMYCSGNPVMRVDMTGMSDDWFVDEVTGDIQYDSEQGKGYEAVLGENWRWLGPNGMFGETEQMMSELVAGRVLTNSGLSDCAYAYNITNGGETSNGYSVSFRGENAKEFMRMMGYKQVPTQATQYVLETQSYSMGPRGRTINWKTENITQINEKYTYIPNSMYEAYRFNITEIYYNYLGPFASESVSRIGFFYTSNNYYQYTGKALKIARGLSGDHTDSMTTIYPNWDSYTEDNTLIIKFRKGVH